MIYGVILCIGDSITYGARDEYGKGYPMYLSELIEDEYDQIAVCINEGVCGETSPELAKRSYKKGKIYDDAYEVVIQTGTNDGKDTVATEPEAYKRNLLHTIHSFKVLGRKIYLCTVPDLAGFGVQDYSVRTQERIDEYNDIIREIAKEEGIKLIDWTGIGEKYLADGVHFNSRGNKLLAKKVFRNIKEEREFEE